MRKLASLLALGIAAWGVASCRQAPDPMRVAVHSAPLGVDPHFQNETLTSAILANVYDGLTEFDAEGRIRPCLAAGWKNPDERTWILTLRPRVTFHDGRPLTAGDVVFSLERARGHARTGLSSYLVEVEAVAALDKATVEIRTRRPFAALLAKLTPVYIVPSDAPETITEPVGTGGYRLAGWDGSRVELVPAARDWRGGRARPPLTFVVEPDPGRRLRMLLAGEVDVAVDLEEDAVGALEASGSCRKVVLPGSTIEYLHLSTAEPLFRDRRVREAVHLAVDRPRYVAEAHHGMGQPVGQLAVPGLFGYAPDLRAPERDLVRARALLAAAGFPKGIDVVLEHRPGRRADVIARQLAEAGLRVTPRESPWPDLYRRLRRGEVGFYFGGIVSPTAETSDLLDGYVHSRDDALGYGISNHPRYSSARADSLIEAASTSPSLVRRRELLQQAMRVAMEDLAFVPVTGLYQVSGVRREVEFRPRLDMRLLGRELSRR